MKKIRLIGKASLFITLMLIVSITLTGCIGLAATILSAIGPILSTVGTVIGGKAGAVIGGVGNAMTTMGTNAQAVANERTAAMKENVARVERGETPLQVSRNDFFNTVGAMAGIKSKSLVQLSPEETLKETLASAKKTQDLASLKSGGPAGQTADFPKGEPAKTAAPTKVDAAMVAPAAPAGKMEGTGDKVSQVSANQGKRASAPTSKNDTPENRQLIERYENELAELNKNKTPENAQRRKILERDIPKAKAKLNQ